MAGEDLVRPSRDGEQFHYCWAARRCLGLLPPDTTLVAVSIEGPAISDADHTDDGVNAIDVAEYSGSVDSKTASHIRYIQLKHSSRRTGQEWVASDLKSTLTNFATRYIALAELFGDEDVAHRFSFELVTNRPIAASLGAGLEDLREGKNTAQARAAAKAMGLATAQAQAFAGLLLLSGLTENFLHQRSLLHDDVSGYLPEADRDAPLQMKNLVTERATTEFEDRPEITRFDVLKALGVDLRDLYPAPSLIDLPPAIVAREQLGGLVDRIVAAGGISVISADAGVGKSVLSTQLDLHLPGGSRTLVYDCFGNGAYRSACGYRHRCRDGLVQLANELAGLSLSEPLIPTSRADPAAYVRAFLSRAERAAAAVAKAAPGAILCIVIDAADNAQIAADELHDGPSFPRLLLREQWPSNMRVVLTARPHRIDMLDPPAAVLRIELRPFSKAETGVHLRSVHPDASDQEVLEFHRQTSMNPRVQATALAQGKPLAATLLSLAGDPRSVEDLIGGLLERAVQTVVSDAPLTERAQIDAICAALATLRPFVPLGVVARVADVPIALVRSLAHDLQRPLLVREDAIQFRDEPTETWFRQRFRPSGTQLDAFIARLLPIAATSAYVAAGLPQLLLEAGRFDELVRLALSDEALPTEPAMARRDVALQRLQFALKAAIRNKRHLDAAKLALKAGGESAADARQQKLISANTDLAMHFLEPEQMLEQVTRRLIGGGGWAGSEHVFEAAFLSGSPDLAGDALSRLRVAYDWLQHWASRPRQAHGKTETVGDTDVAAIALAELNLHGPVSSAKSLRRWRARERSYSAGRILVALLVDAGRFDDVAELAIAAGNDLGLLFAITSELALIGRLPPRQAVVRATRLVTSRNVQIREPSGHGGETAVLGAVIDVVAAATKLRVAPRRLLARTISRYLLINRVLLTGHSANYQNRRSIFLSAFCLRAALRNEVVTVAMLKPDEMRPSPRGAKPGKKRRRYSADLGEIIRFEENMGALLPWHQLAADNCLGRIPDADIARRIDDARTISSKADNRSYDERNGTSDEIALLWGGTVFGTSDPASLLEEFDEWQQGLRRPLYIPTLLALARRAGRTEGCANTCLTLARSAFDIMAAEREDAQGIADTFVDVCRAVLLTSLPEAREYFEQAIEVSGKIGDENIGRWQALSDLAVAAGQENVDRPELAYRFSRVAELVKAYTEHFDWAYSLQALAALSPPSGPTILSRWIDRRLAYEPDTLPDLAKSLDARGVLDARDAICLLPFDGRWPRARMVEQALAKAKTAAERDDIAAHFLRYARWCHLAAEDWNRVAAVFEREGVDSLEARAFARERARDKYEKKRTPPTSRRRKRPSQEKVTRDWDAVFEHIALTDSGDLLRAHARFKAGKPPWSPELFHQAAIARLTVGQEAAFVAAIDAAAFSSLYDARELLDAIPDTWITSLAVRRAVSGFLKRLAQRQCTSISTNRSYPPLKWGRAEAFGVTRDDIFREAVAAMGETSLPVDHDDLFGLAGLLSTMLPSDAAADALSYGLSLMEPLLLAGDDGAWRPAIQPPISVPDAMAGYIWAALASPWAERRWEAAHAVRALCAVDRKEELDHLAELAAAKSGGPFAAPGLTFYALHAELWLMIALSRAAAEHPAAVKGFVPLLRSSATRENPHVLIREFAARALLALGRHGTVALAPAEAVALAQINASLLPPGIRRSRKSTLKPDRGQDGFLFGHDFKQSWLSPLARTFDIYENDFEQAAVGNIHAIWGKEETGRYDRDLRSMRHQFKDDMDYRLQSYWPKVDDQAFYQSVHALLITAGQLLERTPLATAPDYSEAFSEVLDRHRLSLTSEVWLADRRDNKPYGLWQELPTKGAADAFDDADLLRIITGPRGLIVASGDWESHRGTVRQRVDVGSVLVTADRSADLARALQSAFDHDDYRLPTYKGDSDEILEGAWSIGGWIRPDGPDRHLDRRDPWAGGLSSRIVAPGQTALASMGVSADQTERVWRDRRGNLKVRAEIWSDGEETDRDLVHDRGRRLLATRGALDRLMNRTGKHLLFEMRFRTERYETRHTRYMDQEAFDAVRITRYVVLQPGTPPQASPRSPRARGGPRRRTRSRTVQ